MDLNELQSVQSRERQTDSLQQLRATFYQDAADYIQDLEAERDAAAERADDPWNAPEVGRLNDDIDTAKGTVEAIYDRRVGKIVKMASLAAADMPTDDEGLTEEEQALFDQLVAAIEQNREGVFAILDGEDPSIDPTDARSLDPTDSPTQGSPDPETSPSADADRAPSSDDAAPQAASDDDHREVPPAPDRSEPGPTTEESGEPDVGAADLMGGTEAADAGPDSAQSGEPGTDDPTADPGPPDSTTERASADAVDAGHPGRDGEGTDVRSAGSSAEPPDGVAASGVGDEPDVEPDAPGANDAPARTDSRQESPDRTDDSRDESGGATTGESGSDRPGEADAHATDPEVDRTMVRITDDVGPIYGVEGREYDLTADDVVTLPEANVGPLLKQGAAERLD